MPCWCPSGWAPYGGRTTETSAHRGLLRSVDLSLEELINTKVILFPVQ